MTSIITNRDRDCFSCRLVSGTGLLGIGAYVAYQSKRNPTLMGKTIIVGVAIGFSGLGIARIFDLPPFKKEPQ